MPSSFLHRIFTQLFPSKSKRLGNLAEDKAAQLLVQKGFKIIYRNWRPNHGYGEIDIIADRNGQLVFVEVRARQQGTLVRGALSLNHHKKQVLRQTIQAYLRQRRYKIDEAPSWRVDLVEAQTDGAKILALNHFEGVAL